MFPTPKPTPLGFVYKVTTISIGSITACLIVVVVLLAVCIFYETRRRRLLHELKEDELPETFHVDHSTSFGTAQTSLSGASIPFKRPGYRSRFHETEA